MESSSDEQSPERIAFSVRMPAQQYEALKGFAYFTRTSMNEVVSRAVTEFLTGPGRAEFDAAVVADTQERYRDILDKLRDL
jgi:hypothetical protein